MTAEKWLTGAGTSPSISVSTTKNGGPINEVHSDLGLRRFADLEFASQANAGRRFATPTGNSNHLATCN